MPIAAVPNYLGKDFNDISPGMRFGLLLPVWTDRQDQEADVHSRLPGLWDKNDFAARNAWKSIAALSKSDRDRMKALAERQYAMAAVSANLLRLEAQATAPFTTGLGNEHPLENGFAFLNPYGLPYLPGSGVKGVLREAARELASGDWNETHGWNKEKTHIIDALFGLESKDGDTEHVRGALSFWDVIPQIKGDSLMVEIMTPHQSHYYQQKRDHKAGDSTTPHDSGQPNPISFLTVPPGSGFTFFVTCDTKHLARLAPEMTKTDPESGKPCWQILMTDAFEHAFQWLGFGAKTAVGYGAMERDTQAEAARREEAQARLQREAEQARLEKATAGLPDDAARIVRQQQSGAWRENSDFLADAEKLLEETEKLSVEAHQMLEEEVEKRWPGIMENPDVVQGKKQKPKFKPRSRELAKRLLGIKGG